jgi:hypothetical protein
MLFCMRTTLNLDEQLLRELKAKAAREGRTLTSVIEDALRVALSQTPAEASLSGTFQVQPFAGDGLAPGVDLDDSANLLEVMDAE